MRMMAILIYLCKIKERPICVLLNIVNHKLYTNLNSYLHSSFAPYHVESSVHGLGLYLLLLGFALTRLGAWNRLPFLHPTYTIHPM